MAPKAKLEERTVQGVRWNADGYPIRVRLFANFNEGIFIEVRCVEERLEPHPHFVITAICKKFDNAAQAESEYGALRGVIFEPEYYITQQGYSWGVVTPVR